MSSHTIFIYEADSVLNNNLQNTTSVKISIDGKELKEPRSLTNPLDNAGTYEVGWCIEKGLSIPAADFRLGKADELANLLQEYLQQLFHGLAINTSGFVREQIQIDILYRPEISRSNPISRAEARPHSILGFHWELFEFNRQAVQEKTSSRVISAAENLWPSAVQRVNVRRVSIGNQDIQVLRGSLLPQIRIQTGSSTNANDNCFRLLLVVARRYVGLEEPDINPSLMTCALLKLFEEWNGSGPRLFQLEVVRPGSFEELERHLQINQHRPFHAVHFDMHGVVNCISPNCGRYKKSWLNQENDPDHCNNTSLEHAGQAALVFATYKASDGPPDCEVPAVKIGTLLNRHGISCAMLNACDSARSDSGNSGNLSHTFLDAGISNVLAMSYAVSYKMISRFFCRFYEAWLHEHADFSQAASIARSHVSVQRRRYNTRGQKVEMDDYFVPVTYCSNKVLVTDVSLLKPPTIDLTFKSWHNLVSVFVAIVLASIILAVNTLIWWPLAVIFRNNNTMESISKVCLLLAIGIQLLLVFWSFFSLCHLNNLRAKDLKHQALDKNMLNIESELKMRNIVSLGGLKKGSGVLPLVESLILVWDQTNFVKETVIIPASWFLQPRPLRMLRHFLCRILHHKKCCLGDWKFEKSRFKKKETIVVIVGLESLFPQTLFSDNEWWQIPLRSRARHRLYRFLKSVFRDSRRSMEENTTILSAGGDNPYLFLAGSTNLDSSVPEKLANLGFEYVRMMKFTEVEEQYTRLLHLTS